MPAGRIFGWIGVTQDLSAGAVRRDLEAALLEHFVGFQELVVGERPGMAGTVHTVSVDALRRASRPVYYDALASADLPESGIRGVEVNGVPVLLARVDGSSPGAGGTLEFSVVDGSELRCSWHGCRYDVRSGRRVDGEAGSLQVFPVSVDQDRVRVALDVARGGEMS